MNAKLNKPTYQSNKPSQQDQKCDPIQEKNPTQK